MPGRARRKGEPSELFARATTEASRRRLQKPLVVALASLALASPLRTVEPTAAVPHLADGVWRVEGPAIPALDVVIGR